MRFTFVDRVLTLEPGANITTVKCLTLAEEYLADHFPRFPVMPGVLMLQALAEAGAWLVRVSEDFAHTVVTLQEARNIRFADFVRPGDSLTVRAEIVKWEGNLVQVKTQGTVAGSMALSGRLVLTCHNLEDCRPDCGSRNAELRRKLQQQWSQIYTPPEMVVPANGSAWIAPVGVAPGPRNGQGMTDAFTG